MKLQNIGTKHVVTVLQDTPIEEAARLMRDNHVGDVVVIEMRSGKKIPVGILTDRDVVVATVALGCPTKVLTAGDVMTPKLATIHEHESLVELIALMKKRGVKRVPITSVEQELVGVVTADDVIALLAKELVAISEVSKREQEIETERRRKYA